MPKSLDDLAGTLEDIKRLLIMALLKNGATQSDIAKALGVNQSTVSKLVSKTNKPQKAK